MRIAYFAHVNGGTQTGVFHKLAGQVARWRADGRSVLACILTHDDPREWSALRPAVVRRYTGHPSRMRAMAALVRSTRRYDPDLIYMRWDLFYPPMLALPRDVPLVIELNSDDVAEYRLGPPMRAHYNRCTRDIMMRRASAMIFLTSELSRSPSFRKATGVRQVITNGVDLGAYPMLAARASGAPRLVFVGTAGQPWHGVDKLVRLARVQPDWRVDIVGSQRPGSGAPPNMTWHGALGRDDVLEVLGRADVGVGTLALHRNGMAEACSLKLREYLAVGLPVLYGHTDPDIDGVVPESMRLPNTEDNVITHVDEIAEFVLACRGRRVARSAIEHIDIGQKEQQRLRFFDSIAPS
jgi:hypothetical protein